MMINPEVLFHIFQTNTSWKVASGIPEGAVMKGFTVDPSTQMLSLFIESDSFDEVDVLHEVAPCIETSFKKL